jgi:hypothetical protein
MQGTSMYYEVPRMALQVCLSQEARFVGRLAKSWQAQLCFDSKSEIDKFLSPKKIDSLQP